MNENIYLTLTLKEVPRLLSLLDRNEFSSTYGCFDRDYWKYKTRDYNNARMQEATFTLALLYNINSDDNVWYQKKELKKWSIAACKFWAKSQHRNGSFDEFMPREKSHVATAFSSLAVLETCILFDIKDEQVMSALKKSAKWLNKNDDLQVTNHDAAIVPFFFKLASFLDDKKYVIMGKRKLKKVFTNFDEQEGWFNEYDGADIGYQSYTIYFLAKAYKAISALRNKNSGLNETLNKLKKVLENAVLFSSYFVHPDGTIGGNYGSRETSFIIPAGFEMINTEVSYTIASIIRESLTNKKIIGPYSFDDRFLAQELYTYLDFSYKELKENNKLLPCKKDCNLEKIFENSGFYVSKKGKDYLIINLKKSGCFKHFKNDILSEEFTGLIIKKKNKLLHSASNSIFKIEKNKIIINGNFIKLKSMKSNSLITIGTRVLSLIGMSKILKRLIRNKLILNERKTRIKYEIIFNLDQKEKLWSYKVINFNGTVEVTNNFSAVYSTSVGLYEF